MKYLFPETTVRIYEKFTEETTNQNVSNATPPSISRAITPRGN